MLKLEVTEKPADKDHNSGSGARDVRLFRNGSLVKVWRGDVLNGQTSVTLEANIAVVAGENKFAAYAFNRDNVKSKDATLNLTGASSLKRPGTAYVLAIGVNAYSNQQYNLKYAVADATAFGDEVQRAQQQIANYERVEVASLVDEQATKANILTALKLLAGTQEPLTCRCSCGTAKTESDATRRCSLYLLCGTWNCAGAALLFVAARPRLRWCSETRLMPQDCN